LKDLIRAAVALNLKGKGKPRYRTVRASRSRGEPLASGPTSFIAGPGVPGWPAFGPLGWGSRPYLLPQGKSFGTCLIRQAVRY
jgi:hypothetical protein